MCPREDMRRHRRRGRSNRLRSEEHTSELQSQSNIVCRLLLEKKINTRGTLFTVQKALPLFNDGGSLFMTGSVASIKGFPGYSVYAASKSSLHAFARGRLNALSGLALAAEEIEWIIAVEGWPLAGTHRGHAELAAVLKKASEEVETQYPKPSEFVAQGYFFFFK